MNNILAVKNIIVEKIKQGFVPYVMGSYDNIKTVNLNPFGLELKKINIESSNSKEFFNSYIDINGLAFGKKKLGMPKWTAIDCICLPSVTVGFALPFKKLPDEIKKKLNASNEDQLVPVSEYTLIPKINQKGKFVNCTLCSVIGKQNLASLSILLGLAIYEPKEIDIVAQFSDISLITHSKYGNLEVILPKLDMHNLSTSFIGRLNIKTLEDVCYNFLNSKNNKKNVDSTFEYQHEDIETSKIVFSNIKNSIAKYYVTYPGVIFSKNGTDIISTLLTEKVQ